MVTPRGARGRALRGCAALLALALTTGGWTHPVHTTLTEVEYDPRAREIAVVMRVFADDFGAAVTGGRGGAMSAERMARYLARTFVIRDGTGARIELAWRGARRARDVLRIELRGSVPGPLKEGVLRNEMVFEVHRDQVNIVKTRSRGEERTLLFTRLAPTHELVF